MTGRLISEFKKMVCLDCGKHEIELEKGEKLKVCSKCKKAAYCSKECQKFHWKRAHKTDCGTGQFAK